MVHEFGGSTFAIPVVYRHIKSGDSARHVKNCVGVFGFSPQHVDGLGRGQNEQFDFVTLGFTPHFLHDGQSTVCTTADDELVASPGDLLFYRERRVAELLAKFLGRFFLALGFGRDQ
jgi:hypothetical protein